MVKKQNLEGQFIPLSASSAIYYTMATSIPETQLAVVSNKTSNKLQKLPVPSPGPGEVLIKNVAVASNPKDWKALFFFPGYESVEGNDVAGHIVKVQGR